MDCKGDRKVLLGGYESILKHMTPGNFPGFLHAMLYYHTKHVLRKQNMRQNDDDIRDSDSDEDLEEADEESDDI